MTPHQTAVARVLGQEYVTERSWNMQTSQIPLSHRCRFVGQPVRGPQCVTVTIQNRPKDLETILRLGPRFAQQANVNNCRVYRDRAMVRIEFDLPPEQWREVRLSDLQYHVRAPTVGKHALGPTVRIGWDKPHKAVFGETQSGKTTFLADFILTLALNRKPDECKLLLANPKNSPALRPFVRLPHLKTKVAVTDDECEDLLRLALGEMTERRQRSSNERWIIVFDEVAEVVDRRKKIGEMITSLSQFGAELNMNLICASQTAMPSTFGKKGVVSLANFGTRFVFRLTNTNSQAYLATGLADQHPERLGEAGPGDALVVRGHQVDRFRAALPSEANYAELELTESEPDPPRQDQLAGDRAITEPNCWPYPDEEVAARVAFALVRRSSAYAIQKQFGGGMPQAQRLRDLAQAIRTEAGKWSRTK